MAKDTDFDPLDFIDEDGPSEFSDEIDDLDQLWEFADWDESDLEIFEYHGTGDTGKGK